MLTIDTTLLSKSLRVEGEEFICFLLCKFLPKPYKGCIKYMFCLVLCNGDLICCVSDGVGIYCSVCGAFGVIVIAMICSFGYFG